MNNKINYSILLSLILVVPTTVLTQAQAQGQLKVFVASDTVYELELKRYEWETVKLYLQVILLFPPKA
jgi:hypothetical protein